MGRKGKAGVAIVFASEALLPAKIPSSKTPTPKGLEIAWLKGRYGQQDFVNWLSANAVLAETSKVYSQGKARSALTFTGH